MPAAGGNMFLTHTTPNSTTQDVYLGLRNTHGTEQPFQAELHSEPGRSGNTWAAARSKHSGGVNTSFADGRCDSLPTASNPATWKAIGTKAGGEVVNLN